MDSFMFISFLSSFCVYKYLANMCVKLKFLTTYLPLEDKSVALNQTLFQVRVLGIINTVCLILYHRRKLFFSHHDSVKQFEVEFFKLVVFVNIFKMIEKGV